MTDDTELDGIFYKYFPTYAIDDKYLTDAKAELIAWSERREAAALKDLKGWIDRNHYQPINESDRWVQASGEIMAKIDDLVAKLTSDRTGGGEGQSDE